MCIRDRVEVVRQHMVDVSGQRKPVMPDYTGDTQDVYKRQAFSLSPIICRFALSASGISVLYPVSYTHLTDEAMPLSFAPMPRGAFTGFQMIFLFSLSLLPEAESECRVCQPAP